MNEPIIKSLLDTDLYKITMMQVVFHQFPSANVKYSFKCRTKDVNLALIKEDLEKEIKSLCELKFTNEELNYLRGLRYIKNDFVDFLEIFSLREKHINVTSFDNGEIEISIEGPWLYTILFEVPVLALINELFYKYEQGEHRLTIGRENLKNKIQLVKEYSKTKPFLFSDFGTRRRFSAKWQEEVVSTLKDGLPNVFGGTSNVYLAMKYDLTPVGTMAHEYLQAFQALGGRLIDSQKNALEAWAKEYRGDLGIALTDVIGMKPFLKDFDLYFCKLFDGVRHDSGSPIDWANQMLEHYSKNRIDPKTKRLIFSDGLTFEKAIEINDLFINVTNPAYGIGTNLTHDLGLTPLNVVIKMVECNGQPVAKLSDSPGKTMCKDESYINYLKHVFEVK